jgi:hypothetical protein
MGSELGPAGLWPHAVSEAEVRDKFALQQLAWTYCHAVDRRDMTLLRSLYHDDAVDDHGPMFCGGPDEFVAWLPSVLSGWEATSHMIANMLFLVDGDQADGELVTTAYHRSCPPDAQEFIAGGRYLDRYEKRDGAWRFLRRSLVLDWAENRPAADADLAAGGLERGRADEDDPCFVRLPLFRTHRAPSG